MRFGVFLVQWASPVCAIALAVVLFPLSLLAAENTLSQDQKREKRLQFNEYVRREAANEKPQPKFWTLSVAGEYGYDSNAILESPSQSDSFWRETAEGGVEFDTRLPVPGRWGFGTSFENTSYNEETDADLQISSMGPFYRVKLLRNLEWQGDYRWNYLHYPQDGQLNYHGHELTAALVWDSSAVLRHKFSYAFEFMDYVDRRALSASNLSLGEERQDRYHELGYELQLALGSRTVLGTGAAWRVNDSNDVYNDYNDYGAVQGSGYLLTELARSWTVVFAGGYDYKKYDDRSFAFRSDKPERDNYLYLGAFSSWKFRDPLEFTASYLYSENDSNDDQQIFVDSTTTIGLRAEI